MRKPIVFRTLLLAALLATLAGLAVPPRAALTAVEDPVLPGPFEVSRDAYALPDIFITGPTPFGTDLTGRVEVVGSVHAPVDLSSGPFPVVVFLHGRHATCQTASGSEALAWPCPASHPIPIWSYQGYDYVAEVLASHGYIVISVSANGINAVDQSWADFGMDERAQLVLHHLDQWREFNETGGPAPLGDRFIGKLDLDNVGLMGHSRGGEGVAFTYLRNQDRPEPDQYAINAVFALAPVDFMRRVVTNVPMTILLPYCDGDVSDLQGVRFYDDARYGNTLDSGEKSYVLVMGANHNFYNTIWTRDDRGGSDPYCTRLASQGGGRLTPGEQRATGTAYIAGFMRHYIGGEPGFQALFTGDEAPPPSVAPFDIFHGFHAPTIQRLDVNPVTREHHDRLNPLGGRVLDLGLNPYGTCIAPSCGLTQPHAGLRQLDIGWFAPWSKHHDQIPEGLGDVAAFDMVSFRVVVDYNDGRNPGGQDKDFSVLLADASGNTASLKVSDFGRLFHPPGTSARKAVLQTIRMPLDAFQQQGVDLSSITGIRFNFDQQSSGAVLISDLALAKRP